MFTRNKILGSALVAAVAVAGASRLQSRHAKPALPEAVCHEPMLPTADLPPLWAAPDFSLIDQDDHPRTAADLRGKIWIANFVFTGCAGSCPVLSTKMSQLQRDIPDSRVHFVSFDVDPDHDTPVKLKALGTTYHADFSRWHFLLPANRAAIFALAKGFRVTDQTDDRDFRLLHSDGFILIDAAGEVRGSYNATQPADLQKLAADATRLAQEIQAVSRK